MLQTRTRVLDDTLRAKFQSWYPGLFNVYNADHTEHDLAAYATIIQEDRHRQVQ